MGHPPTPDNSAPPEPQDQQPADKPTDKPAIQSTNKPPATPAKRRGLLWRSTWQTARFGSHWFAHVLAWLQLLVMALSAALLFCYVPGSAAVVGKIISMLPGNAVQASSIQGSVLSPSIGQLRIHVQPITLEFVNLQLRWSPWQLWHAQLQVSHLSAQSLHIQYHASGDISPATLPESLVVPWLKGIEVEHVGLQNLTIDDMSSFGDFVQLQGRARYAEQRFEVSELRGTLRQFDTHSNQAEQHPTHQLSLNATLQAAAPFSIQAQAQDTFTSAQGEPVASAELSVSGTLQQMQLQAKASMQGQVSTASAQIEPFQHIIVTASQVRLKGFDLQPFASHLPKTAISGAIDFSEQLKGFVLEASLRNEISGALAEQRLPVDEFKLLANLYSQRIAIQSYEWSWLIQAASLRSGQAQAQFQGQLAVDAQTAQLQAKLLNINPNLWAKQLPSTQLSGTAKLHKQVDLVEFSAALSGERKVSMDLRWQPQAFQIKQLDLQNASSRLSAQGSLELRAGVWSLPVKLQAHQFAPADWWQDERLAELRLSGQLQGELNTPAALQDWPEALLQGNFQSSLNAELDALYAKQKPVALSVHGNFDHWRWDGRVHIQAEQTSVKLDGHWAQATGNTKWEIHAPDLAALQWPGLAGSLQGKGVLSGGLQAPLLVWQLQGNDLKWQQFSLASVEGQGEWGWPLQPEAALQTQITAKGLPYGIASASLQSQGKVAAHQLQLNWQTEQTWSSTLQGGLLAASPGQDVPAQLRALGWRGQLQSLVAGEPLALRLAAPVSLDIHAKAWELGAGRLGNEAGELTWERASWNPQAGSIVGSLRQFEPAAILKAYQTNKGWDSSLKLSGPFAIKLQNEVLSVTVDLKRQSGDLFLPVNGKMTATGIKELALSIETVGDELLAQALLQSEKLGTAQSQLRLPRNIHLSQQDAPLRMQTQADVPSLALWNHLLPLGRMQLDGQAQINVSADGSLAQPQFSGKLQARNLKLRSVLDGINFENGQLDGHLEQNRLLIDRLYVPNQEGGSLLADGEVDWGGERLVMNAKAKLERFHFLSNAKQKMVVSGDLNASWLPASPELAGRVQVLGALSADSAYFEFPEQDTPTLSTDVVMANRPATELPASKFYFGLHLSTGKDFRISGRGIKARLQGDLSVISDGTKPRFYGQIQVHDASYRAWGQNLMVETGGLQFNGSLDNPQLDLKAYRPNLPDKVGVQLNGSALFPRVTLISEPEMSTQDKLSWLLSGRAAKQGGGAEYDVLTKLAFMVGSNTGGESKINKAINAVGLDDFSIRPEDVTGTGAVVSLGKQLSDNIYASYERAANATQGSFYVYYYLTKSISLRLQSGQQNGADFVYTKLFD